MKKVLLLLCLLYIHKSKAQAYKTNFRTDICQCLQDEFATANDLDKKLSQCFSKELTKYATFIDAEIDEDNSALKLAKGIKVRRELEIAFKSELIYSCDFYYEKIETARQKALFASREQDYRREIARADQQVAASPNNYTYLNRAKIYYYKIGDLDRAISDITSSIEFIKGLKKGFWPKEEKLLKALIFEEQKRYDDAIAIYDDLYRGVYDFPIAILRAIVNRKKAGKGNVKIPESVINKSATIVSKEPEPNVPNELKRIRSINKTSTNKTLEKPNNENTRRSSQSDLKKLFKLDDSKNKKTKD